MKNFLLLILIIFSACDTLILDDKSIVIATQTSINESYKYVVTVREGSDRYYLYTNTPFLVGDTIKYSR